MKTVGETLIDRLRAHGVEVVFGIPGVHTVELYRGLAASPVRHVTPRHEQGAGFMADGYARMSGRPGVALVITGPGLTNTITAMAQARADSVPMLVVSGVNARASLGHGRGALHELPDQRALARSVALHTHTLLEPADLPAVIDRAFARFGAGRPGPVHIEIPTDVMAERIPAPAPPPGAPAGPRADRETLERAAAICAGATRPAILAGGGARHTGPALGALAEALDAPVVATVNARGLLAGHPLSVPASPSLPAVRHLLAESDCVLAIGTELGPTDCDMYGDGGFPALRELVRIDVDAGQVARGPAPAVAMVADARSAAEDLRAALVEARADRDGAGRAAAANAAARDGLSPPMLRHVAFLETIRDALPGAAIVGDSTQPVYAGNLFFEPDAPGGWFNSSTGFGSLGYAAPAAIGAKLAAPARPVVCLIGDGGLQFTLAELGSAADAGAPVIFVVWNNRGYGEIAAYMRDNGITPEGVTPSAPDFVAVARAYGLHAERLARARDLAGTLVRAAGLGAPALIEVDEETIMGTVKA